MTVKQSHDRLCRKELHEQARLFIHAAAKEFHWNAKPWEIDRAIKSVCLALCEIAPALQRATEARG